MKAMKILKKFPEKVSYFALAGLIGALIGASCGELLFFRSKPEDISKNILETQRRVREAGGKEGEIQISLSWNNRNDLDLHVVDPKGEEIYFRHKKSNSGGELDVDMNVRTEKLTDQ